MQKISDSKVAICMARNAFFNKVVNDDITESLALIQTSHEDILIDSTKEIVLMCLEKVSQAIDEKNIVGAGFILNFIHNLPFSLEEEKKWALDYFLAVEVASFLRRAKFIPSAYEIVLFACHKIYVRKASQQGGVHNFV